MTEARREAEPSWVPVLRDIARTSRHDLRNALNGLVVNLEVVRSRQAEFDDSLRFFVQQAVDQAEESIRRAESTIFMLSSIVDAIDEKGSLRAELTGPGEVRIGPEVILSIPESPSGTNSH